MIIRVRSNVGVWRVDVPDGTATPDDVYRQIRTTRPAVVYERPLSRDPACREVLEEHVPLQQQGLGQNGAMLHCRVDPATVIDITAKQSVADADNNNETKDSAPTSGNATAAVTNMRRIIGKDGSIQLVPSSEAAATQDKGFRKGMLPLRDMKMHWTRTYYYY